jgi:hypothetical protein
MKRGAFSRLCGGEDCCVRCGRKHAPNRHFASGQDGGGCAIGLPRGATDICGAGTAEMCGGGAVEICGAGATWGTGAAGGAARGHVVFR